MSIACILLPGVQNGKVYAETLSRNGKLYINDQMMHPNVRQQLKPGDEIAIVASNKVQYVCGLLNCIGGIADKGRGEYRPIVFPARDAYCSK